VSRDYYFVKKITPGDIRYPSDLLIGPNRAHYESLIPAVVKYVEKLSQPVDKRFNILTPESRSIPTGWDIITQRGGSNEMEWSSKAL